MINVVILWLKEILHNCIVHPIMPFMGRDMAHKFHDYNANWAFGLERYDEMKLEQPNEKE